MKHLYLISGTFWLLIGLILAISSISYEIGSLTQPGPGFFPLLLGLVLILLALNSVLGHVRKSSPAAVKITSFFLPGRLKYVVYTVLILLFATFLFEWLGYLLTFFFIILFLMEGIGFKNWKVSLIVAFLTAVGVYLLFTLLLKLQLPRGILGI